MQFIGHIGDVDDEVVVVLVEQNCELIKEASRAQDPLEGHLKPLVKHERNARSPRQPIIVGHRQVNVLVLDLPGPAEDGHPSQFGAGGPDLDVERIRDAAVEEGDWGARVDQGPARPITVRSEGQPHVQGWAEDWRIAFFTVREEMTRDEATFSRHR